MEHPARNFGPQLKPAASPGYRAVQWSINLVITD
jgi:hypothetical protein